MPPFFSLRAVARSLVSALLLLAAAGCGKKAGADKEGKEPPPRLVLTAPVIARDAPVYLDEIGTCAALETVNVQAQVTGKIIERHFEDGSDVKKGQLLFSMDPRPYQAALDQAQGELSQARAQLALDQINLQRQSELQKKNVTAKQELDTARASVATTQARAQAAEGAVAAARVNLEYCAIRSPIDGRAGLRQVDAGNVVTANTGAVLLNVQRLDPIYTDFTVAETDLPQVRRYLEPGKAEAIKVLTDAPDNDAPPHAGKLYFMDYSVQSGTGTVRARAETPNPDRQLWPGQFVRVRMILDTLKDAHQVPGEAVQISQKGPFVFVVKPDSTLDLRPVKPGQRQGDMIVINEGLEEGENVVVTGQLALAPGMKVNAKPANAGPPGGGGGSASGAQGTLN